jgi:hypothetical protein
MVASSLMADTLSWNGVVFVEGLDPAFSVENLSYTQKPLGSSHMCFCECYENNEAEDIHLYQCHYMCGGTSEGSETFTGDDWCTATSSGCTDKGCGARSVRGGKSGTTH